MTQKFRLPAPIERYDRENEAQTRRAIEDAFSAPASGGGGLESRRDVVFSSSSLANLAEQTSSKDFGAPSQHLLLIETDRACRLRLYAIAATQTSDQSRLHTTPPQAGIGVLLDAIWLTAHTKYIAPTVLLYNGDDPADNTIYWTIQNVSGSTGVVTITAVVVSAEA